LYDKESDVAEWSGWGFEFTFRLARDTGEPPDAQPPMWALSFLQNLARYVVNTGNVFEPNHYMDLNGPIALETQTAITAAFFASDPQLPEITTPNGRLKFVQVVGVTGDELSAAQAWDVEKFIATLSRVNPMLVTDLVRRSILDDPAIAEAVRRGQRSDGSSTGVLYNDNVAWSEPAAGRLEITLGAKQADALKMLLAGRVPFGRPFVLQGPNAAVEFKPAEMVAWQPRGDGGVTVDVTPAAAQQLIDHIRPKQGLYALDARVVVRVVPSLIRDHEGKVAQTIGE